MPTYISESPAKITFADNLSRLTKLLQALRVDSSALDQELARTREADDEKRLPKLEKRVARRNENLAFVFEWHCVMLATFTETYLQDVHIFFSGMDIGLMNDAEQKASYEDVQSAKSLDELAEELRGRWARNVVDKGGPAKWIERLKKMGAKEYDENMADVLEELWGLRHVVVHRAGFVTLDFIRRHPKFGFKVGDRISLSQAQLSVYSKAVSEFVTVTDTYFINRYKPTK